MKIDSTYKPNTAPVANRTPAKSAAGAPNGAEAVSLSPLAGTLQSGNNPPVNSAKIAEIKEAIAQGRFKINPEAIAGSLIETARDLLVSQRKA